MVRKICEKAFKENLGKRNFTIEYVLYADGLYNETETEDINAYSAKEAIAKFKKYHNEDIVNVYDESDICYDIQTGEELDESKKSPKIKMSKRISEARNPENAEINKKIANTIKTKLTKEPKYRADLEAEGFELFNHDGSAYNNWEVRGTNGNTVCISKGYDNKPRIYAGYKAVANKGAIDDFDFYNYLTMDMTTRADYRQHGGIGKTDGNTIMRNSDGSAIDANFEEPSKTQQYRNLKKDIRNNQGSKVYYLNDIKKMRDKIDQLNRMIDNDEVEIDKHDEIIVAKLDEIDKLLKDMKVRTASNESISKRQKARKQR